MILLLLLAGAAVGQKETLGRSYWEKTAKDELEASLNVILNTNVAKNVIIFVGDGMGPTSITAARIYNGGETSFLSWERFPHMGAFKTYAEDKTVPDSASTATAMFTGYKTNYNVLGLPASVNLRNCTAALQAEAESAPHLTTLAQAAGKSTGIVTTARVTHATPAAMYGRSANRNWECSVPEDASECKDVGRQLVEDLPAKNLNVIMGGGLCQLKGNESDDPAAILIRTDDRNLIEEWAKDKSSRGLSYAVVNNTKTLRDVDVSKTDYLLGTFSKSHMAYEYDRNSSDIGTPSLIEMTSTALHILKKNKNGFLLMVEAEHIDLGHHKGKARRALNEVVLLSNTVNAAIKILEEAGIKDETLVIVTSDHSHTLTMSGYPARGNNILGIAQNSLADGIPYTTLSYANGNKDGFHYSVVNGTVARADPSKVDTTDWEYGHQVGVLTNRNTHGGHDVMVYASGPYAHLFHHMHEQNYLYYVVKHAAKLGDYNQSSTSTFTSSSSVHLSNCYSIFLYISSLLFLTLLQK